jgi:hypothetical protein
LNVINEQINILKILMNEESKLIKNFMKLRNKKFKYFILFGGIIENVS